MGGRETASASGGSAPGPRFGPFLQRDGTNHGNGNPAGRRPFEPRGHHPTRGPPPRAAVTDPIHYKPPAVRLYSHRVVADDYAAIVYAVRKGIIVVGAAGNGAVSLDDPIYDQIRSPLRVSGRSQLGGVTSSGGQSWTRGAFWSEQEPRLLELSAGSLPLDPSRISGSRSMPKGGDAERFPPGTATSRGPGFSRTSGTPATSTGHPAPLRSSLVPWPVFRGQSRPWEASRSPRGEAQATSPRHRLGARAAAWRKGPGIDWQASRPEKTVAGRRNRAQANSGR